MDTAFAKIVTDPYGVDHILIEGRIVTLNAPRDENNALVDVIVRGLRNQNGRTGECIIAQTTGAGTPA
jgi:hypothetical protein